MAKSKTKPKTKKVLDEEDDAPVEVDDEPVEIGDIDDVEDVDAEVEDDAPVDDDVEMMKGRGDDGDDVDAEVDEVAEQEPSGPPSAKTSKLTIALMLFNWAVVPIFFVIAYLDHEARARHSYVSIVNFVGVWGLPLRQEDDAESIYENTRPLLRMSNEELKAAYKKRGGTISIGTDEFKQVEEPVPLRLRPRDVTSDIQRELFGSDAPVATLEDEVERLIKAIPDQVKAAGERVLQKQKDDVEKRDVVRKTLIRIAWNVWQVKNLEKKLAEAKGAALDDLVKDAVQRRIYYDILAPYNRFRPDDPAKPRVERLADLDQFKSTDQVKDLFVARMQSLIDPEFKADHFLGKDYEANKIVFGKDESGKDMHSMLRDAVEKRQTIGFMLFALSQVTVPTLNEKLLPKGVERAGTVSGFYEFTNASIHYVKALALLEERRIEAIKADRQGYLVLSKENGMTRTDGFIDEYERMVDRLVTADTQIKDKQDQLARYKTQREDALKTYAQRAQQHADTLAKLLKARQNTLAVAEELRKKQDELRKALEELSDAGEVNFTIEAEIRRLEMRYIEAQKAKEKKKR